MANGKILESHNILRYASILLAVEIFLVTTLLAGLVILSLLHDQNPTFLAAMPILNQLRFFILETYFSARGSVIGLLVMAITFLLCSCFFFKRSHDLLSQKVMRYFFIIAGVLIIFIYISITIFFNFEARSEAQLAKEGASLSAFALVLLVLFGAFGYFLAYRILRNVNRDMSLTFTKIINS